LVVRGSSRSVRGGEGLLDGEQVRSERRESAEAAMAGAGKKFAGRHDSSTYTLMNMNETGAGPVSSG
jgi:hypothetical protein